MKLNKKILFTLTFITFMVMKVLDVPLINQIASNGIVSFELAGTLENSVSILNSWNAEAKLYAGISLGFDYLFMLMYSLLFYSLIKYFSTKITNKLLAKFGNILAKLMLLSGILDAIENYALIKLYLGDLQQTFSTVAYYSATLKFLLLGIGFTFILINIVYSLGLIIRKK